MLALSKSNLRIHLPDLRQQLGRLAVLFCLLYSSYCRGYVKAVEIRRAMGRYERRGGKWSEEEKTERKLRNRGQHCGLIICHHLSSSTPCLKACILCSEFIVAVAFYSHCSLTIGVLDYSTMPCTHPHPHPLQLFRACLC